MLAARILLARLVGIHRKSWAQTIIGRTRPSCRVERAIRAAGAGCAVAHLFARRGGHTFVQLLAMLADDEARKEAWQEAEIEWLQQETEWLWGQSLQGGGVKWGVGCTPAFLHTSVHVVVVANVDGIDGAACVLAERHGGETHDGQEYDKERGPT